MVEFETEEKLAEALSAKAEEKKTPEAPPPEPPKTVTVSGIQANLLQDVVQIIYDDGNYKFITYEHFLEVIKGVVNPEVIEKGSPYHLPSNCFYIEINPTNIRLAMYYPETYREIKYSNKSRLSVIPNIVTAFVLTKLTGTQTYKVTGAKYMCTSRPLMEIPREFPVRTGRGHTSFTILPFTNFYDNGELCYGSNSRVAEIKLPELRPLHSYYELLFTSWFNNDLGIYALKDESPFKRNYAAWYDHLAKLAAEKKPFPYNELY